MKTIINNEGKKVKVTAETYAELEQGFKEGGWAAYIKDVDNKPHMVIIPNNFALNH